MISLEFIEIDANVDLTEMLQQISNVKDHILNTKEQVPSLVRSPVKILSSASWVSQDFFFLIISNFETKYMIRM